MKRPNRTQALIFSTLKKKKKKASMQFFEIQSCLEDHELNHGGDGEVANFA